MSATCPTGTVVTTSRVAASRSSGSTVSRYSSVSAICAGSLPYGFVATPSQLLQQRRLADTRHPGDQYPRQIVIVAGRDSIPASRAAEWSPYLRRQRRPEPAFWVAVSGTDSRRGGRRLAATRTTGPAWLRSTA